MDFLRQTRDGTKEKRRTVMLLFCAAGDQGVHADGFACTVARVEGCGGENIQDPLVNVEVVYGALVFGGVRRGSAGSLTIPNP